MPTPAQLLIERANALAAGKNGSGNVMPQDWLDIWQQTFNATPEQASQAHGQASTFYNQNQRAMNEGEITDLWSSLANPNAVTPRPIGPMVANPATGTATHQPALAARPQGRMFVQPSAPDGSLSWEIIEQLKGKYGTGLIESMVAEPEKYGAQLRNWAQAFTTPTVRSGATVGPAVPKDRKVPNPWQVNPAVWDSLGNMGQQLALGFAEDEGWDAGDYQSQINATRPMGQAPQSVRTMFQQPTRRY